MTSREGSQSTGTQSAVRAPRFGESPNLSDVLGVDGIRPCPWLVCEQRHRFVTAAYRFAPAMMPGGAVPIVDSTTVPQCRDQIDPLVRSGVASVLLWSIEREDVLAILDQAIALANHPRQIRDRSVFPIIACDQLRRSEGLALAETGVSVFLRHPEDLIKFAPLIHAHFASFASGVK